MTAAEPTPAATAAPAAAPVAAAAVAPEGRCENCGEPLLGGHCYACGQPTKGLVRHFSSILGDFFDTVLNIDSRVFRTLGPLLFKPGYLSQEYFNGHRVRFVSPVRLFVFLSIITFLFAQWSTPDLKVNGDAGGLSLDFDAGDNNNFASANTVAEVEAQRKEALAGIDRAIKESAGVPGMAQGMKAARQAIERAAAERIAELRRAEAKQGPPPPTAATPTTPTTPTTATTATTETTPTRPSTPAPARAGPGEDDDERAEFNFNGKPWHATENPLKVDWLPEAGNAAINSLVGRAKENSKRIRQDPNLFKSAIFSALPTTLFVLVPVFALLLKVLYVFKRRLYMEHLIVALHSHAFLCLAVILLIALTSFQTFTGDPAWLSLPLGVAEVAIAVWMPLYLLLTQKRIYRQGWIMTLLKFGLIGVVYFFMLIAGITLTMLAAVVWL